MDVELLAPQAPRASHSLVVVVCIMTLHHTKHHQTYITSLNTALTTQSYHFTTGDLLSLLALQQTIKFHAGGHINHSIFWTIICSILTTRPSMFRLFGRF